jgi:hypothetical protein
MITAICENTNTIISLNMDIFLLKTARNAKSDTKSGGRGVVLVISMPGKKVLKRCSGLRLLRNNFRNGVPAQKYQWAQIYKIFYILSFINRAFFP